MTSVTDWARDSASKPNRLGVNLSSNVAVVSKHAHDTHTYRVFLFVTMWAFGGKNAIWRFVTQKKWCNYNMWAFVGKNAIWRFVTEKHDAVFFMFLYILCFYISQFFPFHWRWRFWAVPSTTMIEANIQWIHCCFTKKRYPKATFTASHSGSHWKKEVDAMARPASSSFSQGLLPIGGTPRILPWMATLLSASRWQR